MLRLLIGVLICRELMPAGRLVGFAVMWLALGVFTWDGIRHA
jgi:chloramphenicol-sensitive protein RarD